MKERRGVRRPDVHPDLTERGCKKERHPREEASARTLNWNGGLLTQLDEGRLTSEVKGGIAISLELGERQQSAVGKI